MSTLNEKLPKNKKANSIRNVLLRLIDKEIKNDHIKLFTSNSQESMQDEYKIEFNERYFSIKKGEIIEKRVKKREIYKAETIDFEERRNSIINSLTMKSSEKKIKQREGYMYLVGYFQTLKMRNSYLRKRRNALFDEATLNPLNNFLFQLKKITIKRR